MIFEIAAASSILSLNDDGQLKELTELTECTSPISRAKEGGSGDIARSTGLYYYLSGRNQPQRKR
ncbi:hypothetical protein N7524_004049 [Penicillium chrysogenum]|nr:hypothetical protein N7524_004049 [Penicillium chrysogenum]